MLAEPTAVSLRLLSDQVILHQIILKNQLQKQTNHSVFHTAGFGRSNGEKLSIVLICQKSDITVFLIYLNTVLEIMPLFFFCKTL